ncbi:DUF6916 family protein [Leifsonia aquatica]|uniref:DUF6916 family protein n=1 Tax=Leifsonia aquatica TaxID=144185 RepID=UPI0004683602|nr:hypothetical protein [Leifsonia aquatica]
MSATHADWTAAIGVPVRATSPDGTGYDLRIVEVSPARESEGWVAYTVRFEGGPDLPSEQQTYEIVARPIAEQVFLVPTGHTADGLALDAVFAQAAPRAQEES